MLIQNKVPEPESLLINSLSFWTLPTAKAKQPTSDDLWLTNLGKLEFMLLQITLNMEKAYLLEKSMQS